MNVQEQSELTWFKSSYSSGDGGECVEIALHPTTIHIRDSKQPPSSAPTLALSPSAWKAFLSAIS
jgi:hypothetical protein